MKKEKKNKGTFQFDVTALALKITIVILISSFFSPFSSSSLS